MAVFEALPLQSRLSSGSALSLPVNDDDFGRHDIDLACSPFSRSYAAAKRSQSISPQLPSNLTLRPARCDANSTLYQNGQIMPTSSQLSIVRADKTPFPPPLPNVWAWSPDGSSCLASLPPTRLDEGPSNWYGSTLQSPEELLRRQRQHSSISKPLLSPIKFSPDVQARTTGQVEKFSHPDRFDENELLLSRDDANSFHSSDWDLTAPSRRLSYGEPLDMIEAGSVHNSTRSIELRGKAGWLADDKSFDMWVDDTVKAQAGRTCHSEPSCRKKRLWLDLVKDDEEIEEAVSVPDCVRHQMLRCIQHATAVTTSPSKPRMISIRRRRATAEPSCNETPLPSVSNFQIGVTTFLPEMPPQSPTLSIATPERLPVPLNRVSNECVNTSKREKQHQAFNKIRSRTTWSMTPPTSGISTPWSSETIRQVVTLSPPVSASPAMSRPATPPPMPVNPGLKLSDFTIWVLTELEAAIGGDANQKLKLDTVVIQKLQLPPKQRRIPDQTPLTAVRSSSSTTEGPLSSHTSPSQFAAAPLKTGDWPSIATKSTAGNPDETLSILSRIFPLAPRQTLSHLFATILAHQFVSTIHLPLLQQTAATASSPFAARHISKYCPPIAANAQVDGLLDNIPSKARAMLGLPLPGSPGKPKDGRPPLPSFWRKVEKMEWRQRVGELEAGLQRSVRQVIRELVGGNEWRSGERWLDALVGAVQETIRMGKVVGIV